jgi:hypothetical protein
MGQDLAIGVFEPLAGDRIAFEGSRKTQLENPIRVSAENQIGPSGPDDHEAWKLRIIPLARMK